MKGWSDPNSMLGKKDPVRGTINGKTKVSSMRMGLGKMNNLVFHMVKVIEQLNPDVYCAEC